MYIGVYMRAVYTNTFTGTYNELLHEYISLERGSGLTDAKIMLPASPSTLMSKRDLRGFFFARAFLYLWFHEASLPSHLAELYYRLLISEHCFGGWDGCQRELQVKEAIAFMKLRQSPAHSKTRQ